MRPLTPEQLLAQLEGGNLSQAYLFLGPETYRRGACREKLIERVLPPDERETGFVRHDLSETSLVEVMDDARMLSLFSTSRLIWVSGAEEALPRTRRSVRNGDEAAPGGPSGTALEAYLKSAPPGVTVVFDASRYDFQGEDKTKLERVRKFYSNVPVQVEFNRLTNQQVRRLAEQLAKGNCLTIDPEALDLLLEAVGTDATRVAMEIEKLQLLAGERKRISSEDVVSLVPDARASTIFALVDAVQRGDRVVSLQILQTLLGQGEYLPLALAFLGTHFRLALTAKEAGLQTPQQVQNYFSRLKIPVWRSKAEQIAHTVSVLPKTRLEAAVKSIYAADRAFREARPDDRIVMENFILCLMG